MLCQALDAWAVDFVPFDHKFLLKTDILGILGRMVTGTFVLVDFPRVALSECASGGDSTEPASKASVALTKLVSTKDDHLDGTVCMYVVTWY